METSSALLAICVGNSPVAGEFPTQRPVTRSFDVFFICAWMKDRVNNREAGDLRGNRTHYDITVMFMHGVGLWNRNSQSSHTASPLLWEDTDIPTPLKQQKQNWIWFT